MAGRTSWRDTRGGWLRGGRAHGALLAAVALLVMAGVLLIACDTARSTARQPGRTTTPLAKQTATRAPSPTASPTQDPSLAHNAELGCAPNPPKPQPGRLTAGPGPKPNEVALTFDDGPTPYTTPPILDVLERTQTPATFFVEGQYIQQWPDLLRREYDDGFAIAVHTWDHPMMTQQSDDQLKHQFGDTLRVIRETLGKNVCVWIWRPPYADVNQHVMEVAAGYGLTTITWDASGLDWERPGVQRITNLVLAMSAPGAIILLHDGPALRDQTAAALPAIIDGLKQRGLTPVTLPKLLADTQYPGVTVGPAPTPTPTATPSPSATATLTPTPAKRKKATTIKCAGGSL